MKVFLENIPFLRKKIPTFSDFPYKQLKILSYHSPISTFLAMEKFLVIFLGEKFSGKFGMTFKLLCIWFLKI